MAEHQDIHARLGAMQTEMMNISKALAENNKAIAIANEREAHRVDWENRIEDKVNKSAKFVDNCTLGRKVILWGLSGVGTSAAIAAAAWDRIFGG